MNIRNLAARTALIAFTAVLPAAFPLASYAKAPVPVHGVSQSASGKQKLVQMTIKNVSTEVRTVRIGDENVTLQANESHEFKAPVNTAIYAVGDSVKHKDGDILLKITSNMNGVVCSLS